MRGMPAGVGNSIGSRICASGGSAPRAKKFRRLGVSEDHVGVALQRVKVMFREPIPLLGSDEKSSGLLHQNLGARRGKRFLSIQRFIHRNDQLGQRVQPRKPRVAGEEIEKMTRRRDPADGLLVSHALRIHQRFVQIQEGVAEWLQRLLHVGFHGWVHCGPLPEPIQTAVHNLSAAAALQLCR